MLLHIDASRHAWLADGQQDLVSISDDATNEVYYAALVPEENTETVLRALSTVLTAHGVFCALYTDRASHHPPRHRPGSRGTRRKSNGRCSNWASS
jgi:hypothetical protein